MTARHLLRPSFSSECIIPLYFNKFLSICYNISIVLQSYTFFTKKPHNLSLFFSIYLFIVPFHGTSPSNFMPVNFTAVTFVCKTTNKLENHRRINRKSNGIINLLLFYPSFDFAVKHLKSYVLKSCVVFLCGC